MEYCNHAISTFGDAVDWMCVFVLIQGQVLEELVLDSQVQ